MRWILLLPLLILPVAAAWGFEPPPPPGMTALPAFTDAAPPPSEAAHAAGAEPAEGWSEETVIPLALGLTAPVELRHARFLGLPSNRVTALALDAASGRLVVGTADRGVAAVRLADGSLEATAPGRHPDLGRGSVLSLLGTADGALLVGTTRLLHVLPPGSEGFAGGRPVAVSPDLRLSPVHALAEAPWIAVGAGVAFTGAGIRGFTPRGELVEEAGGDLPEGARVRAARLAGDRIYLCADSGLYVIRAGLRAEALPRPPDVPPMHLDAVPLGGGTLVTATTAGLALAGPDGERGLLPREAIAGLPADMPTALARVPLPGGEAIPPAREGDPPGLSGLWVGWKRGGLSLGGPRGFVTLPAGGDGMTRGEVTAILPRGETIYVATAGGLNRFRLVAAEPPAAAEGTKDGTGRAKAGRAALPADGKLVAAIGERFGVRVTGPWSVESLRAIYKTLAVLPESFRGANRQMVRRGNAGSLGGLGSVGGPGIIQIFDAALRVDPAGIYVVVHEMAHNFQGDAAVMRRWEREIKGPSCTGYGNTNPYEDMAESVATYYTRPAFLKESFPSRYEFVKRHIMRGKEFTGDEWK